MLLTFPLMRADVSVVVPFDSRNGELATAFAQDASLRAKQVILVGPSAPSLPGVQAVHSTSGKGGAIREALSLVQGTLTVIQEPDEAYPTDAYLSVLRPLEADRADAVFGARLHARRAVRALEEKALSSFTRLVADVRLADPLTGVRAFRTSAIKSLRLLSDGEEIDSEIIVKLAAHHYRFAEVPLELTAPTRTTSLPSMWRRAQTLVRYAFLQNDADNAHEGYNTLLRMESAPNYNAWIGRRVQEHLGKRVLEIGAGIGTITREIEAGRELLIALEIDPFYFERLKNLFRDKPHVRPYLTDVAHADWRGLASERIDTIVLSNVLEHVEDDGAAVLNFRDVLQPGGRVVVLVPALPQIFGSMDEAVGHFRRYTPETLRKVLESNGFTVEKLDWMNLVGIPGWFVNGRILKRRAVPPLQLRLYDAVAPLLAEAESRVRLPIGMSLFAVARVTGDAP